MNISTHSVTRTLTAPFLGWRGALACACAAGLLAACGGGGGSAGTNSNGVAPSKAASVLLIASAETIDSSGLDGTEVTLTAIVKDAGGNALANETVSFTTSSGTVTSTNRVSNAAGQVIEKLSVKGDTSLRTITVTAIGLGVEQPPTQLAALTGSVSGNTVSVTMPYATFNTAAEPATALASGQSLSALTIYSNTGPALTAIPNDFNVAPTDQAEFFQCLYPLGSSSPAPRVPEVPVAALVPVAGVVAAGALYAVRRRRSHRGV